MAVEIPQLRLCHAPRSNPRDARGRFDAFITGISDPHVRLRQEEVVIAAVEEQNLFFVEHEAGHLVGTTGFYRHGSESNLFAEIGSTLVHPECRGVRLQMIMYRYIISLEWLAYKPLQPVIAVVDDGAVGSYTNIERCGFVRLDSAPERLRRAKPNQDWTPIESGEQRLYRLTREGIADSLRFVADNGARLTLTNRDGITRFLLSVEFNFLRQQGMSDELRLEAEIVRNSTY